MLQNASPLRKSAPWPPNISDEHVFYIAPATRNASLQILFKCPTPAILFGNATTPSRFAHFLTRCTIPCACHAKRALNVQKWSERGAFWCVLHILTSKCASRRALFRHLNFQKWSENGVFWCVLCILTSKCISRHNGVHFFISHLASWLSTRRFSELTFRPSGAPNHWKNTVFRDFPTFSRTCIFFLLTLSPLWSSLFCSSLFYSSLCYSSLLSDPSHLCFSSVNIVGSLTSKLPSITISLKCMFSFASYNCLGL